MKPDSCIFAREYGNRLAVTAIALASYVNPHPLIRLPRFSTTHLPSHSSAAVLVLAIASSARLHPRHTRLCSALHLTHSLSTLFQPPPPPPPVSPSLLSPILHHEPLAYHPRQASSLPLTPPRLPHHSSPPRTSRVNHRHPCCAR